MVEEYREQDTGDLPSFFMDLLFEANEVARTRGNQVVGLNHLVLVIISDQANALLINDLGLDLTKLREEMERFEHSQDTSPMPTTINIGHSEVGVSHEVLTACGKAAHKTDANDHNELLRKALIYLGEEILHATIKNDTATIEKIGKSSGPKMYDLDGPEFARLSEEGQSNVLSSRCTGLVYQPDEVDIYCNKVTFECWIFHEKDIDKEILWAVLYEEQRRLCFIMNDGGKLDLGVELQHLVFPHFVKAKQVSIVQTVQVDHPLLDASITDTELSRMVVHNKNVSKKGGKVKIDRPLWRAVPVDGTIVPIHKV